MKNVKEYLEKAYAAAMYDESYETAELIELVIESLRSSVEQELANSSSCASETTESIQKNVVAFPIRYSK